MAHPQGVDEVWNYCAGRSGMEKYRDNDPGKEQTAVIVRENNNRFVTEQRIEHALA